MRSSRSILIIAFSILFGIASIVRGGLFADWIGHQSETNHHESISTHAHNHDHDESDEHSHQEVACAHDSSESHAHAQRCCDTHHHHAPEQVEEFITSRDHDLVSPAIESISDYQWLYHSLISWQHRPPWPRAHHALPSHLLTLRTVVLLT